MTSELKVDKLNTVAGGTGNISISDGVKLTGAAGSIVAPGQILQVQATFLGQGSNYGTGTDPNVGHHTSVSTSTAGAGVDGDGYWHDHVIISTSTTPTATNWSVDITPTSATSLIKFEFNPHIYASANADAPWIRIVRTISGGTPTFVYQPQTNTTGPYGLWYGGGSRYMQVHLSGYDKPATTTSTNYYNHCYS